MKGKLVKTIAAVYMATMLFGMTALAAPKTMSDGGTFDPEYYAQQNPDVVAALGTNENVLYQHYLNNGKAEGRLPYAATGSDSSASVTVVETKQYDYVANKGATSLITQMVKYAFKDDTLTVQGMSDGTLFVSHSKGNWVQVYAPTGVVDGDSVYYKCIGQSTGEASNDMLLYQTDKSLVSVMHYGSSGSFNYYTIYMIKGILK